MAMKPVVERRMRPVCIVLSHADALGMIVSAHRAEGPAHLKIKRAKVIVDDTGRKVLTKCESCGKEKYIIEGQTTCDECRARRRRK
jgi:hypothetical protein